MTRERRSEQSTASDGNGARTGAEPGKVTRTGRLQLKPATPGTAAAAPTLDQQYAKAGASHVFAATVLGRPIPVMTYVSAGFDPAKPVDVVIFFHGHVADYSAAGVDNMTRENPAIAARLPEVAADAGDSVVVLAPQLNTGDRLQEDWTKLTSADHQAIVAAAFAGLKQARGLADDIPRGSISLAGHSAGGKAVGGAASAFGDAVTDITLQDAGYDFTTYQESFRLVREWLITGAPGKTLRIISKAAQAGTDTRGAAETPAAETRARALSQEAVQQSIDAAGRTADLIVTAEAVNDQTARTNELHLIKKVEIRHQADQVLQGAIHLFYMAAPPGKGDDIKSHFGVRDAAMAATVHDRHAGDDFGAKAP